MAIAEKANALAAGAAGHSRRREQAVVRSFGSYDEARGALDALEQAGLPDESLRIVAGDLLVVERAVGGSSLLRALSGGSWCGALVGGVVGVSFGLLGWLGPVRSVLVLGLWGVIVGQLTGGLLGFVRHCAVERGGKDVQVASLEASRYDIVADHGFAAEARRVLSLTTRNRIGA